MHFARRQLLAASVAATGAGLIGNGARLFAHSYDSTPVKMERGYTDCRFGQLHYTRGTPVEGNPRFPPLVLLHQTPSSSVEYENLIVEMGKDRHVIAFDTPGSGMSDWPPGPMEIDDFAAAFADAIENMGLAQAGPVDVFGYHTGTLLAAELGLARPDLVGRLVMSGIPFRSIEERRERLEEIAAAPKLTESGDELLAMQRNLWEYVVERRDKRVPLDRAARIYIEKAKPLDRYWWPYRGVWTYEVAKRFPLLSQPLLVIQPHEPLLQASRDAAALVANSRFVELPELSINVFEVGVAEFAGEMRRFLV